MMNFDVNWKYEGDSAANKEQTLECPKCMAAIPGNSRFCNMCGTAITEETLRRAKSQKAGKMPLVEKTISTAFGNKKLSVYCQDIIEYAGEIDLLTISAKAGCYDPVLGTMIEGLETAGNIVVQELADNALLKISGQTSCWVSHSLDNAGKNGNIKRIGCVEGGRNRLLANRGITKEESLIESLKAYYKLLELIPQEEEIIRTLVMPVLGSGSLRMDNNLIIYPLVNEAINALKSNPDLREIVFMERDYVKAKITADTVESIYQLAAKSSTESPAEKSEEPFVFVSYCTEGDFETAKLMSEKLTASGIRNWFAPNEIKQGNYADKIVAAIDKSTHFICIISENSMKSEHVLNEVDLAFQKVKDGMVILPFRLDEQEMNPPFKYYLSRMQWSMGCPPPVADKIDRFITEVFGSKVQ